MDNGFRLRTRLRGEAGLGGDREGWVHGCRCAHEKHGLAKAAPWVVQLWAEDAVPGHAAVVRRRRSDRDEVRRRAHLTGLGSGV